MEGREPFMEIANISSSDIFNSIFLVNLILNLFAIDILCLKIRPSEICSQPTSLATGQKAFEIISI